MKRVIALILSVLVLVAVFSGCRRREENVIILGAGDFTEQFILGYMMQILVDETTDLNTRKVSSLSATVLFTAFTTGSIDAYIGYTGTVYANFFGYTEILPADEVFEIVREGMRERHNVRTLERLGFNNTYALAVRPDTAEQFNLRTISDLARASPELTLGATIEFVNREDGLLGVQRVYGANFRNVIPLQGALRYVALMNDEVQVVSAFSTDGMLLRHELVVLEDDLEFFPPYNAMVMIREEIAAEFPRLVEVLGKLTGTLTDYSMRELNYRVDVLQQSPQAVARDFLREAGLIR